MFFFSKQPSCEESNAKNGQATSNVKNVNAKNFGIELWSKKFYFFNYKFTRAKFLHNFSCRVAN